MTETTPTFDRDRTEVAVEYPTHESGRYEACDPTCVICREPDMLSCARGRNCAGARRTFGGVRGAPLGIWLDMDPETTVDIPRFTIAMSYPTMPHTLFCEDCVNEIDHDRDPTDAVLTGEVGGTFWDVHVDNTVDNGKRFFSTISTADRTGGTSWERELGSFATLAAAAGTARCHAELHSLDELDGEWHAGLHRPER